MKDKYGRFSSILMLAVSLALLVIVSVPAKPALAQQSITLSIRGGFLGSEVIVTGEDFNLYKGAWVYLYWDDTQLQRVDVSESGDFTVDFNVPSTAIPGNYYTISIKDDSNTQLASQEFLVIKATIDIEPEEGKVDDWIAVNVNQFEAERPVCFYFSSDDAFIEDGIGSQVTTYECTRPEYGLVFTNTEGRFDSMYRFKVPAEMTHGTNKEYVHEGQYYIYATYFLGTSGTETVVAFAKFTVLNGSITVAPEDGEVGSEIQISGEGLRNNQKITIRYDGDIADIISGNIETDSDGNFSCYINVPESPAGTHIITATDESGNSPEAEFSVRPTLTVSPTSTTIGNIIKVSGVGYGEKRYITITLNGNKVTTTPISIMINRLGNFSTDFIVPANAIIGTNVIVAKDDMLNTAETQLTVEAAPPTPASISLSPSTSLASPGYVGMEMTIDGTEFKANTPITISYGNGETITIAETTTDARGDFSTEFSIPPSTAGSHIITASDGTSSKTSAFIMESEAPIMPMLQLPEVAGVVDTNVHFDWQDVTDPSGITYTLQVGTDPTFNNILIEEEGLNLSKYDVTDKDKLGNTDKDAPLYWRVKAVDGAFNESDWTTPRLFYVGSSGTSIPAWILYVLYGLGGVLLIALGFWVRKFIASR